MTLLSTIVLPTIALLGIVAACFWRSARRLAQNAAKPSLVLSYSPNPRAEPQVSHRAFDVNNVEVEFSLVIPCFNEADRILKTLQSVTSFFDGFTARAEQSLTYEVIVVDDGSKDTTIEAVRDFIPLLPKGREIFRIFKLEKNCGKGAAVQEGLLRSRGALCLFLDADDATEISEFQFLHGRLTQLVNFAEKGTSVRSGYREIAKRAGIIVGSRAHLQSKAIAQRSHYRNFLMHGFHWLVWLVTFTAIRDTQCGFKLFTRTAVHHIFPHVKIKRWCFDVEVLLLAAKNKIPIGEVPVRWTEVPGSKVKMHHILHMAWDLGIIFFGYTFLPGWKTWKCIKQE